MTTLMLPAPRKTERIRVRRAVYVGTKRVRNDVQDYWHRAIFRSEVPPTEETHPQYDYAIGPFRTVRGAKFMVHYGWNGNPHVQSVEQCERLGKEYADELKDLPKEVNRR